jgi:hypothetical protein
MSNAEIGHVVPRTVTVTRPSSPSQTAVTSESPHRINRPLLRTERERIVGGGISWTIALTESTSDAERDRRLRHYEQRGTSA